MANFPVQTVMGRQFGVEFTGDPERPVVLHGKRVSYWLRPVFGQGNVYQAIQPNGKEVGGTVHPRWFSIVDGQILESTKERA